MIKFFQEWYRRYFSDPQAVLLAVFLLLSFGIIIVMGTILAPNRMELCYLHVSNISRIASCAELTKQ